VLVSSLILPVPRAARLLGLGVSAPGVVLQRGFGSSAVCDGVRCRRARALSPDPNPSLRCSVPSPYGVVLPCGGAVLCGFPLPAVKRGLDFAAVRSDRVPWGCGFVVRLCRTA
jgi:hypothetical protein